MSDNNKNKFVLGTFTVDIPSAVNNANVNPQENNVIKTNGNYPVPANKTGWNSFQVQVENGGGSGDSIVPTQASLILDNRLVDYVKANQPDSLLILPNNDQNIMNMSLFETEGNRDYATEVVIDLEMLKPLIRLEPNQVLTQNNTTYDAYDYEKDDDIDLRPQNQRNIVYKSRDGSKAEVEDDPTYRNIGSFRVEVPPTPPVLYQYETINKNGTYIIPPGYNGLNTITVNFEDTGNNTAIPVEEVPLETQPSDPNNPDVTIEEGTLVQNKTVNNNTWYYNNRYVVNYGDYWEQLHLISSNTRSTFVQWFDNGSNNNFYSVLFTNPFNQSIVINVMAAQWQGIAWFFCISLGSHSSIHITNDVFPTNDAQVYIDKSPTESDIKILSKRFNPIYFEYRNGNNIWDTKVLYSVSPPSISITSNQHESVNLSGISKTGIYGVFG